RVAGGVNDNFLRERYGVAGMTERFDVELAAGAHELHEIQRCKIAGGIVEEHVLGAGIGGVDAARCFGSVPAIDGGIELHTGIAALPGRFGNLLQNFFGIETANGLAVNDGTGPPIGAGSGGFHELVGGPHGIVGVLEKDRAVGFAVERGIVAGIDQGV